MFKRNRRFPLFFISLLTILTVAGCGSGISTTGGNPAGFSNSSLNGTYAFAISGTNVNTGGFFAVAGSFTANGSGSITGGVEDINSPTTTAGLQTNVSITGSYNVHSDGRTVATINSSGISPAVSFTLDFVLLNSQKGLVIRFDGNGTASGSLDLQTASAANLATLAGPFAFNLSGVDFSQNPEAAAGLLTFDASGNITSGVLDSNDNLSISTNLAIAPVAGGVSSPSGSTGRGTVTFTSPVTAAAVHFAYYVVDSNHLKVIQTDSSPTLAGDAFRQTSTAVSGNFVFTLAGSTTGTTGVFVAGGVLNTDGVSAITGGVEDIDDGGSVTVTGGITPAGTFSVTGGRGILTLTSGETLTVVFYPSSAGLLLLDLTANHVATGTALAQSGTFSNGSINNSYGLNFTGVTGTNVLSEAEIDVIAQFTANGTGTFTGALDINNFGATSVGLTLNGDYSVNSNGRGMAALRTSAGTINIIFYMASNSQVVFVEMDESFGQVSAGVFNAQ